VIDSLHHVQVVGALARLAGDGGWARVLAGQPLEDPADLADADLLLAAGVLTRRADGLLEPADLHPWYEDPEVLRSGLVAGLRRALRRCETPEPSGSSEPSESDEDLVLDQDEIVAMGMASKSVAAILADAVIPMLPGTRDRFASGTARFLDVGVGTGVIAETLCREFPGTCAVGIDVSSDALTVAKRHLSASEVAPRIELRQQSVVDLHERDGYDLAWMPQVFLSREDLERGLGRVHRALRDGCWLVMPVAAVGPDADPLERAAVQHDAALRGGGTMSVEQAVELLQAAGFGEVRSLPGIGQALVLGRKVPLAMR
jgi:SAM-dependent methyltransferase